MALLTASCNHVGCSMRVMRAVRSWYVAELMMDRARESMTDWMLPGEEPGG